MDETFLSHITEIRKRLIYGLIGFFVLFVPFFHFDNQIYQIAANPLLHYLPFGTKLIATDITSPFLAPLKLSALLALIFSLPNILYQLWRFLAPGMYLKEQKLFLAVIPATVLLFIGGCVFCYFLVLPVIFSFISHIKSSEITMMTDISKYLDFVITLFLIFGICFQMPIIVFTTVYFNIITLQQLKDFRRYMFVIVFILGAILAPPDIISQTMLALPLYILYEIGIFSTKFINIK